VAKHLHVWQRTEGFLVVRHSAETSTKIDQVVRDAQAAAHPHLVRAPLVVESTLKYPLNSYLHLFSGDIAGSPTAR